MFKRPYFKLHCAIFRVINALRNRNDSFDCHALTSQSKVSTHVQYVGGYVRVRVRVTGNNTRTHADVFKYRANYEIIRQKSA